MRDIPRAHTKLMSKCLLDYVLSAVVGPCTHGRSSGLGIEWGRMEWPDVTNSGLGTVLRHCPIYEGDALPNAQWYSELGCTLPATFSNFRPSFLLQHSWSWCSDPWAVIGAPACQFQVQTATCNLKGCQLIKICDCHCRVSVFDQSSHQRFPCLAA